MKLKVILTGATGMVGEGVLHECLNHPDVTEVLTVSRRIVSTHHPKLKAIIHDFKDFSTIQNELKGYNACFFCLGMSSIGIKEEEFTDKTYHLTLRFAHAVASGNPDLTFCYISGSGTDSTEKGRSMWARVKGRTENALMDLFKKAYMFRPGYMQPTRGLKNTLSFYKYVKWMYPGFKLFFPSFVCTLKELGLAMINSALKGYESKILEVKDIKTLAGKT